VSAAPAILQTDESVPLRTAARELGVSASTVRRWIQHGAPCVHPGESGRGKGALVRVGDLRRWRVGFVDEGRTLERIAETMLDAHLREFMNGKPAWVALDVREWKAAFVLVNAYCRAHAKLTGTWPDEAAFPAPIEQLMRIARNRA